MKNKKKSSFIFNNWQIKILCLLLAILVYFVFSYAVSGERVIRLPLQIKMPADYEATSLVPEEADVIIRGSEKQIYMIDISRIKILADFSEVKEQGVASAPIQINYTDLLDYIDITDVSIFTKPSVVKIYFE